MPPTHRYMNSHVIDTLRREIAEAGGNEIFAVLSREQPDSLYTQVRIVTRGTAGEVPALVSRTRSGDMTVHNHPSGVLQPSQADLSVATMFGEEGRGSMIVNNSVEECYVIAEAHEEDEPVDVDETLVERIFAADGPLAQKLPRYENRPQQTAMARKVAATLNTGQILAVEAGTGTGKSLAYLVPSFLWTKHNKGRVVIATKTIALQEQLVYKDIPTARKALPDAPRAALVKGRNNYICLRKLQDLRSHQLDLFEDEERTVKKEVEDLGGWMDEEGSGDRADLPFEPSREAWDLVRSDADMCLGAKCPFFQKAPFYVSRRQASQARVLVVNQALLFADLALRSASGNYKAAAVIPPYDHIVLDEAHSIEDIATNYFGEKVSSSGLRFNLGKFYASGRSNRGVLHRLFQTAVELKAVDLFSTLEERLMPSFVELRDKVTEQLYALSAELHELFNRDQRRNVVIWVRESMITSGQLRAAREQAKVLLQLIHEMLLVLKQIRELWKNQSDDFLEKTNGMLIEMEARLSRMDSVTAALKNFAVTTDENKIPWLELRKARHHDEFEYKVSPLDITGMLRDAVYKPFKSVTLTSATLDLEDNFKFLSKRTGLHDFTDKAWSFVRFDSPFDYQQQARLGLVHLPSSPNQPSFGNELVDLVLRCVFGGEAGGTLVLFTSYSMLNRAARELEIPLARNGVPLLVQGKAQRSHLVDQLKKTMGVLLGTDSFWEGVDVPGPALNKVIITKLPFRQIGDPIFEARCAAIDKSGGSSFNELSLPLALLKFKQGAGRLIRHREDKGVLIVADGRIRSKSYGKRFLKQVNTYPATDLRPDDMAGFLLPGGAPI